MSKKSNNTINVIFTIGFVISLSIFSIYVLIIKNQREISEIENRYLMQTQDLIESDFIDLSFQNNLDLVLSDQFLFRYNIVKFKKRFDYLLDLIMFPVDDTLLKLSAVSEDGKIMRLGMSNFMIGKPMIYEERIQERVQDRIQQYNELSKYLSHTKVYVYHPTQPHETDIFDFHNELDSYGPTVEKFFDDLLVPYDSLEINEIDNIIDYFYSSDHHWSNRGSYQGYIDIINLLDPSVTPLNPREEKCGLDFEGSYSTRTGFVLGPSDFCVYKFDLVNYEVIVNDVDVEIKSDSNTFFDNFNQFDKGAYYYNIAYDRYEKYGSLVKYQSDINSSSVLVVGDSYMPPILPLLAQHYGTVYALYPVEYNTKYDFFDYYNFLESNRIDKVVFMSTIENYFFDDEYGERYKLFEILPTWRQ